MHTNLKKLLNITFILIVLMTSSCTIPKTLNENSEPLRIHDIQGCTHQSLYDGKQVTNVPGIVTSKNNRGFYFQDDQPDSADCSSEALYVFMDSFPDVMPGDRVLVSGTVDEFFPGKIEDKNLSITEISTPQISVLSSENALPPAISIGENGRQIPSRIIDNDGLIKFEIVEDGIDFFESLESMLIQVEKGVVVGPRDQYNEITVMLPHLIGENLISPESALIQTEDDLHPERIKLNLNSSNVEEVNLSAELAQPIQGILDYSYGNYKINVFGKVEWIDHEMELTLPPNSEGSLRIASFNVENLSRFDPDSKFKGIAQILIENLQSPDIIVLHEIMDDSGVEDNGVITAELTVEKLVNFISAANGPKYEYIQVNPINDMDGGIAGGNIRSVILYRSDRGLSLVTNISPKLLKSNPERFGVRLSEFSGTRKPLLGLFDWEGRNFLVMTAHLTSRGADSPIYGIIQPIQKPEEYKRIKQAECIRTYLEEFTKQNPDTPVILAGDMNDVPWSPTITTLTDNTLKDLGTLIPQNERFSYILDGNAFQLDYIMTSNSLIGSADFSILHVSSVFDHTHQISDHDPILATINLN